ncbi:MAG: DUF302 domain-containing protein [Methyloligellaceae bacterium]
MRWLRLAAWTVMALGLGGPAAADESSLRAYGVEAEFADVLQDVQDAVINRGLRIDYRGRLGDMLKRTGKDVGSSKPLYRNAEYLVFCSANLSRKMMEADTRNIRFCPFVIFVYELASAPGTVQVGYRRPRPEGTKGSQNALAAIDKLLDGIAREATE